MSDLSEQEEVYLQALLRDNGTAGVMQAVVEILREDTELSEKAIKAILQSSLDDALASPKAVTR